jgi:cell wall-associated NlpC family hydrolase
MLVTRITESAMHFIGTPYSFGGTSSTGFDCSGYVQRVFATVGIFLPRTADEQYLVGRRVDTAHAKRGDLVFFQTYAPGASHVGIYLGNNEFIHSSSSHGVMVSSLSDRYWSARFIGIERVVGNPGAHSIAD